MDDDELHAPRVSRAELIARRLENEILATELPPGHRLGTKEDLRTRFRVAAGTVNEAVRSLEMRGLVQGRPGPRGGVFVSTPSPRVRLSHFSLGLQGDAASIADCLAVRNALEGLVAEEAARHADEDGIADLRRIVEGMEGAEDASTFLRANWAMHRRLADMSPNQVLRNLYRALLDVVESELEEVETDSAFDPRETVAVHRALVDAVASGDLKRVAEAVRLHTPSTSQAGGEAPSAP